jgi:hypothetical protein
VRYLITRIIGHKNVASVNSSHLPPTVCFVDLIHWYVCTFSASILDTLRRYPPHRCYGSGRMISVPAKRQRWIRHVLTHCMSLVLSFLCLSSNVLAMVATVLACETGDWILNDWSAWAARGIQECGSNIGSTHPLRPYARQKKLRREERGEFMIGKQRREVGNQVNRANPSVLCLP